MIRSLATAASDAFHRASIIFFRPQPQLCLSSIQPSLAFPNLDLDTTINEDLLNSIWNFAVPKSKISRSKKRMKTTVQKRIKLKKNIIIDERTGELTLKHKLPFNWKDYLPEAPEK